MEITDFTNLSLLIKHVLMGINRFYLLTIFDIEREGERKKGEENFRVLRIGLVLASTSKRSLSHSALHHAEI